LKHAVYGVVLGIIFFLFVFIGSSVQGRAVRDDEAEESLSEAVESTMTALFSGNEQYGILDNEKFVADFLRELSLQLGSDSELSVEVEKADYEKGMLSIKVTEKYTHPNGNEGVVEAYKTVIYDKESIKNKEPAIVSFYRTKADMEGGAEPYKTLKAVPGETVFAPDAPEHPANAWKFHFVQWVDAGGHAIGPEGLLVEEGQDAGGYAFYAEYAQ